MNIDLSNLNERVEIGVNSQTANKDVNSSRRPANNLTLGHLKVHYNKTVENINSFRHQGKLNIPGVCEDLNFDTSDLIDKGEIGRGAFGFVNRMVHKETHTVMAVKRIRSMLDDAQVSDSLKDLDVVVKSVNCPYIVKFYGALFKEGDCWICMELMSSSLDKFYRFVYRHLKEQIPESILGKIAVAVVLALDYLKTNLNTIHRDVKPSNILIDRDGSIKLCDFGISGRLVDSIAKTRDVGCKPYMAPERIDPRAESGYGVESDVWSLGITLMELATGRFPYPIWKNPFEQLTIVLKGPAPRLRDTVAARFTPEFVDFLNLCLNKTVEARPKYTQLKTEPFFVRSQNDPVHVGEYFSSIFSRVPDGLDFFDYISKDAL